jgi:hypothetical protein
MVAGGGPEGGHEGCEPETVVDRPMEYKRQAVTGETLLREECVDAFVGGYAKEGKSGGGPLGSRGW